MNKDRIMWFGRYEGWLRLLARGVRDGDAQCIDKAVRLFDLMLPDKCVVVPMPSHMGQAKNMLHVAERLCGRFGGRVLRNALRSDPHESSCAQKLDGRMPAPFRAFCRPIDADDEHLRGGVFVIDNVICTGVTASAALSAMDCAGYGDVAKVCTIAMSAWR